MTDTPLTEAELAAREVMSEWEVFTASDGNNSIRMRSHRSEDQIAREVVAAVAPIIKRETLAKFGDRMGCFNPSPFRTSDQDNRPPNNPSISNDNP
jgi:hypothetical protein